jgi:hypothetical protein
VDPMLRQFFYYEVERQCQFALMAYEDVKQALAIIGQRSPLYPEINWNCTDAAQRQANMGRHEQWVSALARLNQLRQAARVRFWYSVQAFLVAAGNISKLLWPSYQKGEMLIHERGPELRAGLAVEEDSPLAPRTLRNHFEHFDVRLEQWAVSSKKRVFADSCIGLANLIRGHQAAGVTPEDYLRNFDPVNFAVTFRGETYQLRPIIEAIQAIHQRVTEKLSQRFWEIPDPTQGTTGL